MNITLTKIKALAEFIIAICLFYLGCTVTVQSILGNIIIFVLALFFFMQALGNIDKINGYGNKK